MTPVTIGPSSPLSSAPPSSSSSSFLSADDDDTFGFPPIHSPHASHLPPPTKRARRRPRKSTREGPSTRSQKLQAIHKLIIRRGWKMTDLLDAYAAEGRSGSPESKQYRNFWHQFKRFAYRDLLRKDNEDAPLNKKDWDHILNAGGYDHVVHVLRQELKKLGQSFSAGTFQYPTAGKSLDLGSLDFLESLRGDVQTKAPRLTEFLCMLARPAHKSAHQAVPLGPHQTIWVAMFLFAMQRKKCNNIPRLLGMYFVNSGVKKRVVDLLSTIGLCVSYTTVQECFKGIADVAEVQVRILGSDPRRNDAYDNYDFAEHKSGERLGQRKKFITLTNGVQFIGIEMPTGGLRQDMWKPSIQLKATDIVRKLGGSRLFNQVRCCFFIYNLAYDL